MNNSITLSELGLDYIVDEYYSLNNKSTSNYIDRLVKINKLPFVKAELFFTDNTWDFSGYSSLNIMKKTMRFHFEKVSVPFREEIKKYVLVKLLENNNKVQSINRKHSDLAQFFNFLSETGIYSIKDVSVGIIDSYMKSREHLAMKTNRMTKMAITDFYKYYSANYEDLYTLEIRDILDLGSTKAYKAASKQNKTCNIPSYYFDEFLSVLLKIINSESEPDVIKATACIYLILSQTGLRLSEVLGLEIDALQSISIFDNEATHFIKYKTWKRVKGNNTSSIEKTYVNELTKLGFDTLTTLYADRRNALGTNYLFLGGSNKKKLSQIPIDISSFDKLKIRFFLYIDRYIRTINLPEGTHPQLTTKKVCSTNRQTDVKASSITFPESHQFRVHMATELYNKGVPLKYIEKFMGHLTQEMKGYYYRPTEKSPQENMDFTIKTMKDIVSGSLKVLGGKPSNLTDKIQEFINSNNYNVEKDLDTIVSQLAQKVPVRQKTGGVCIKSSMLRECSKDAATNEFFCAYGVCPNIFHFYYMVDVSLRQARELVETININKTRGLHRQVEKETNMLHTITKKRLLPELDELQNMIVKKGSQFVIGEYPDLQDIVMNLDDVYKEVNKWKLSIQ